MEKKHVFIIIVLLIIGVIVYFLTRNPTQQLKDEQEKVMCGNVPVFRYKYPSQYFPAVINNYSNNFKITSGVLDQLVSDSSGSSSISSDVRSSARSLRDVLNQDNIFFEDQLKAYFMLSNNYPCDDSLRYLYTAYLNEMPNKVLQLKQFVAQVSTPSVSNTTGSQNIPADSVLAVVDTAKANVESPVTNPDKDKLIVLKDQRKLNVAIDDLQKKYILTKRIDPAVYRMKKMQQSNHN